MKKLLLSTFFFLTLLAQTVQAQENIAFQITSGFNADVIANGSGSALTSTTVGVDVVNFCFMAANFQPTTAAPPAYALPVNGQITNVANPGVNFQMGNYTGNNSLRLPSTNSTGTITFGNPMTATKLYVLVTAGSGVSTVTASIQFADNSTQVITNNVAPDWFNSNTLPVVASGFGRVNRNTNAIENPSGNPRLYQMTLNILPANQAKLVTGIQFTKTSTGEGVFNAFAVTAETLPSCPQPLNLLSSTTVNSGTVSWTAIPTAPTNGYDYYFSTTNTPPTASTVPTGNVPATQTSIDFSGLETGETFYCWVRSNCDDETQSSWALVSFTTGQIEVIYTEGDLPTLYSLTVTTATTTTCPGTLSVTIPAGYQIASTATSYEITATSGAFQSEQRSLLFCTTTNTGETTVSSGSSVSTAGTSTYNRTNLSLANGATGVVAFELRSWRTWGGSGCNTTYNKVDNNTWKIIVTIEPLPCDAPTAPTADDNQTFCGAATLVNLTASGVDNATILWFATATSNAPLSNETALETGTYYVAQTLEDCESERTMVSVTVTPIPLAPEVTSQTFCGTTTIADLDANGLEEATILWYETMDSETALNAETEVTTGVYYVSQMLNSCESERVQVGINVLEIPAQPSADAQTFCGEGTVADLMVSEETTGDVNWYQNNDDIVALEPAAALVSGTYYVSQSNVAGCESEKVAVSITVLSQPAMPIADAQAFCGEATVADLMLTEETIGDVSWFDNMEAVEALASSAVLVSGTYYVSQTVEGCASELLAVIVNVYEVTATPVYEGDLTFNDGTTLSEIGVDFLNDATVQWYILDENSNYVAVDATTLVAETTYYVSQTVNGCESAFLAITVDAVLSSDIFDRNTLQIYPNPVAQTLFVSGMENPASLQIINMLGQIILSENNPNDNFINVSSLEKGTYLLQIKEANNLVKIIRFVKE
uniref:Ig-like domain-containing protein n=1 Tax=Flavobacterium sp. TaxID=239 RepID=UPI00404931F5